MAAALCAALLASGCAADSLEISGAQSPEQRALAFLIREVPAWSRDNGCFSCHNNGDAARALYAAKQAGYGIPAKALAETTAWVSQPARWDDNKGDPGFSDKRLADIQFAASLLAAIESGHLRQRRSEDAGLDGVHHTKGLGTGLGSAVRAQPKATRMTGAGPLREAARRVAAGQCDNGAWCVGDGGALGSPATYGTSLATFMALCVLKASGSSEVQLAIRKAEKWLRQAPVNTVLDAATQLLFLRGESTPHAGERRAAAMSVLRRAQAGEGGFGPYPDSPAEVFDTAMALLALAEMRDQPGVEELIQRGRSHLAATQLGDGSWPATTRPTGGQSYAQTMSTTGWATLALLKTQSP